MFHKSSLHAVVTTALALLAGGYARADCVLPTSTPAEAELIGRYVPDAPTAEELTNMGFSASPEILVGQNLVTTISDMPIVWRNRSWVGDSFEVESATGIFQPRNDRVPGHVYIELTSINGVGTIMTPAAFQICKEISGFRIEIPYRGWNSGVYLVFSRKET
jgi:hypothetical protein